jgi:hypothetical protein
MANNSRCTNRVVTDFAPCLCDSCLNQQLDRATWRTRGQTAQKIVRSLSIEQLRRLPSKTRGRLQNILSDGHVSRMDRKALDKISLAELMEVAYQPRLIIQGPADFVAQTRAHLDSMAQITIGRRLLRSLVKSGKRVTIIPSARLNEAPLDDYRGALARGTALRWRSSSGRAKSIKGNGSGSDTTIKYNPNRRRTGPEPWQQAPPAVWLAHELVHADDAAYGRMDPEEIDGLLNFERQAIGLPPYEWKEFTENKLRAQWPQPQPQRTRY